MTLYSDDVLALNPELAPLLKGEKKPLKFHNQPVTLDGIRFDSGKEAVRANELLLMLRAGEIIALVFHKRMPVHPEGSKPIYYECDFCYVDKNLKIHVEDAKGFDVKTGKFKSTPEFKLKARLFEAKYKVKIELV